MGATELLVVIKERDHEVVNAKSSKHLDVEAAWEEEGEHCNHKNKHNVSVRERSYSCW